MSEMKSIHFPPPTADEEIRAILDNRKTATRRVVKPEGFFKRQGYQITGRPDPYGVGDRTPDGFWFNVRRGAKEVSTLLYMPYRPGDILYVRETWAKVGDNAYGYKADDVWIVPRWRPSIHMPREAARIFLRVTDVRVERLQNMQPYDIAFEGFRRQRDFIAFWDSSIKKADRSLYGWDASPWVWVIEFERISREEAAAHGS